METIFSFLVIFLGLICPALSSSVEASKKWYGYEPAIVELSGKVIKEMEYGPPGFGESPETDQKNEVYMLVLDHPINVKGYPNTDINSTSFSGLKKFQLIGIKYKKSFKKFKNKSVKIKGSLFEGFTGEHYTKVLIQVDEIRLVEKQTKK